MKKVLCTVLLAIVPSLALAEGSGCFIEHSNPTVCSTQEINCSAMGMNNVVWFGSSVAHLCERVNELNDTVNFAAEVYSGLQTNKEALAIQLLDAQAKSREKTKLIKLLMRQCGDKCAGIK